MLEKQEARTLAFGLQVALHNGGEFHDQVQSAGMCKFSATIKSKRAELFSGERIMDGSSRASPFVENV
jgi:hypothetical protein